MHRLILAPRFWNWYGLSGILALAVFAACGEKSNGGIQIGNGGQNVGGQTPPSPGAGVGGLTGTGGTGTIILGGAGGGGGGQPSACQGLECQKTTCKVGACVQMPCAEGAKTTLTGVVHDPAGKVPIYNVIVYVPNGEVPPITTGASCDRCDASVMNPVVSALTDTRGRFVLEDVPVGANIPLVIQIGKWRRQITVPTVNACVENPLTDINQTRLPKNQTEGNIPLIAITTGGADSMECLPRRMGLDDTEFTTETGMGRIHLYSGLRAGNNSVPTTAFATTLNAGATLTRSTTLWNTTEALRKYDIVILSCEGATNVREKPETARQAMYEYTSVGGRVFASHWHHIWFSGGPDPVPQVGAWSDRMPEPPNPSTGTINQSFAKGQALAEWLVNVGASTTPGQIEIQEPRDNIQSVNAMYATEWITTQNPDPDLAALPTAVQLLTFNAPLDVASDMQCGRTVFNDLHVSATGGGDPATGGDAPGRPFPEGCAVRDLSAQEKAVEFMLFDLSSCVQDDEDPPEPPMPPR